MAVTLKAPKQGLETVDKARRNKEWKATAICWYDAASSSVAALALFYYSRQMKFETVFSD